MSEAAEELNSRREFLRNLTVGSLSWLANLPQSLAQEKSPPLRRKRGGMYYRRLGRTGLDISEISLGGSPLPDWSLFLETIERGVNYIDTSCTYDNGNSERQIGRLFQEIGRDKVFVGTKFHLRRGWDTRSVIKSVEESLRRLRTDTVDVLLIHGAEREEDLADERLLAAFAQLKKAGKYRFQGLSCHVNHHRVVKTAVECGHYDMVQVGYNAFDIDEPAKEAETHGDDLEESGLRALIGQAASKGVGVIAMKTLKVAGRKQNLEAYKAGTTSLFQAMLKWVLENKNVTSVVTEMLNRKEMEEDLGVVGASLEENERQTLFRYVAENAEDYCHLCGRCQACCPSEVATSEILRFLAYHDSYGKADYAKKAYAEINPASTSLGCRACGLCEETCPFQVKIRKRIREGHTILAG